MPLTPDQRRTLLTNVARDNAEHLRDEIERLASQAGGQDPTDPSQPQSALGEYMLRRALRSAQRMVESLEAAMKLSEEMTEEARQDEQAPPG